MAEKAAINQVNQIGVQSAEGTAAVASKRLSSLGFDFSPQTESNKYKPKGTKFTTVVSLNKEHSEGELDGQATYDEIIYALAACFGNKTITPQGSSGYLWAFEPLSGVEDVIDRLTVQRGDRTSAVRIKDVVIPELTITIGRDDGIVVGGTAIGDAIEVGDYLDTNETYHLTADSSPPTAGNFTLTVGANTTANIAHNASPAAVQAALEALASVGTGNVKVTAHPDNTGAGTLAVADNVYIVEFVVAKGQQAITMTGTFTGLTASGSIALSNPQDGAAPTRIPQTVALATHTKVYLADAHTGPWDNTTKLNRLIEAEFSVSDRFEPFFTVDSDEGTGATGMIESEPTWQVTLQVHNNSKADELLTGLRAGQTYYLKFETIDPNEIESGVNRRITLLMAVKVYEHGGFSEAESVDAAEFTLEIVDDSTWGHAIQAEVVNTRSAL